MLVVVERHGHGETGRRVEEPRPSRACCPPMQFFHLVRRNLERGSSCIWRPESMVVCYLRFARTVQPLPRPACGGPAFLFPPPLPFPPGAAEICPSRQACRWLLYRMCVYACSRLDSPPSRAAPTRSS